MNFDYNLILSILILLFPFFKGFLKKILFYISYKIDNYLCRNYPYPYSFFLSTYYDLIKKLADI